jgi:hypothetical protein
MGEEQVVDTEAVEMPELEGEPAEEAATRRLPAPVDDRSELSLWREEMRTAAIAAAGGPSPAPPRSPLCARPAARAASEPRDAAPRSGP